MSIVSADAWKCMLCGYIHGGKDPPDFCPICGAQADQFEADSPQKVEPEASPVNSWFCTVCGFVHEGECAPDSCPVCSAPEDAFVLQKPA